MVGTLEETVTYTGDCTNSEWFEYTKQDKDRFFELLIFIRDKDEDSKLYFSDFRVKFQGYENLIYYLLLLQIQGLIRSKIQFVSSNDANNNSITFDYVEKLTEKGINFTSSKGVMVGPSKDALA